MFSGLGKNVPNAVQPPVSAGNKPFIVVESAAAFHDGFLYNTTNPNIDPGPGRLAIKQAWWRQTLNSTLVSSMPKYKAYCSFEFVKAEELTLRDFSMMGPVAHSVNSTDMKIVQEAFKNDLRTVLASGVNGGPGLKFIWANTTGSVVTGIPKNEGGRINCLSNFSLMLLLVSLLFFTA